MSVLVVPRGPALATPIAQLKYATSVGNAHGGMNLEMRIMRSDGPLSLSRVGRVVQGEILNLESPDGEVTARDLVLARGSRPVLGGDPEGLVVRVNGRPVALSKPLRHGDVVDFVTRPYRASRGRANRPKVAATRRQVGCFGVWGVCVRASDGL
jgi:sulfur carrier protein ThiS